MRDIRSRHFEQGGIGAFGAAGINALSRLLIHVSIKEDQAMLTRSSRTAAVALAAAVALTSLDLAPASAANLAGGTQATNTSTIDLSARRRHYHRGNAAVFGAVAGLFGIVAATAAANSYRHRYYYGEPYYYGPYGYGAPYAYAPSHRFYRGHYGHHRHFRSDF